MTVTLSPRQIKSVIKICDPHPGPRPFPRLKSALRIAHDASLTNGRPSTGDCVSALGRGVEHRCSVVLMLIIDTCCMSLRPLWTCSAACKCILGDNGLGNTLHIRIRSRTPAARRRRTREVSLGCARMLNILASRSSFIRAFVDPSSPKMYTLLLVGLLGWFVHSSHRGGDNTGDASGNSVRDACVRSNV